MDMIIDNVELILADTKDFLENIIAETSSKEEQTEIAKQLLVRLIVATTDYWKCRRTVEYVNDYVESLHNLLHFKEVEQPPQEEKTS